MSVSNININFSHVIVFSIIVYRVSGGMGSSRSGGNGYFSGGYNGGGYSGYIYGAGGGGATDIRTDCSNYATVLIVAGGGGGGKGPVACSSTGEYDFYYLVDQLLMCIMSISSCQRSVSRRINCYDLQCGDPRTGPRKQHSRWSQRHFFIWIFERWAIRCGRGCKFSVWRWRRRRLLRRRRGK
jgi:hypothetical protein